MNTNAWTKLAVAVVCCLLAGCGGEGKQGPATASVSGTVKLNGKPLENVEVRFVSGDFEGFGITDAEGKYELVQGAAVGENKVYFSKLEGGAGLKFDDPESGMDAGQAAAMIAAVGPRGARQRLVPKQVIPKIYASPQATPLKYAVSEGGATGADFNIK